MRFAVASNVALDWAWFAVDPWEVEQSNRLLDFFRAQGLDDYVNQYALDGKPLSGERSAGLDRDECCGRISRRSAEEQGLRAGAVGSGNPQRAVALLRRAVVFSGAAAGQRQLSHLRPPLDPGPRATRLHPMRSRIRVCTARLPGFVQREMDLKTGGEECANEEYARRQLEHALTYYATDLCDYPGGYVDGKIVNVAFLEEVADRGSEPARAAFEKVIVAYSHLPQLDDLLRRITAYPEARHAEKIRSFYAQLLAMQWYVGEAEKRNNRYLMMHVVSDLVLFGGRLILAHNRMLYPYHKWFLRALQDAPQKPDDLMALIDQLLNEPNKANGDRFCEAILNFTAVGYSARRLAGALHGRHGMGVAQRRCGSRRLVVATARQHAVLFLGITLVLRNAGSL